MPIQFRCSGCNQKLAISRRKAGKVVKCPACATQLLVPTLEEAAATGRLFESPATAPAPPDAPPERPAREAPPEAEAERFGDVPPAAFEDLREAEPPAGSGAAGSASASPRVEDAARSPEAPARTWETDDEDEEEDGFQLQGRPFDESGLDMTPMVDVTFLLLIFFMITASFSVQKSMETEAPKPDEEGAAQLPTMDDLANDSVIVEVDENDAIFVDDVQVGGIGDLVDVLGQKVANEQKLEMIIEPHPQAKHGTVVQVTDAGIEVGMQRIRRVTRKGD